MSTEYHKKEAKTLWVVLLSAVAMVVVIKWSIGILKDSGSILLDLETVQKVNNSGVEHINHHHIT